jgi:uncharacterized repeat protein (TIGR03806 family)
MFNKTNILIYLLILFTSLSCKSNDEYIPILIEANLDEVEVIQNNSIEITIFSNDINIPSEGTIELSTPNNGLVIIQDSNNFANSLLVYTPSFNYYGQDSFQYTVCNNNLDCATGIVTITILPVTPVNYNLDEFPYDTLSEYNFYEGLMSELNPVYGVIPYKVISSLFIDYASAKTFIWMPNGARANYINDYSVLDFPEGTILMTTHYYENVLPNLSIKNLETRLLIKKEGEWLLVKYVWNEEQTEATYATEGSTVVVNWLHNNEPKVVSYRIPSYSECFACHNKYETILPIGPKPQNINFDFPFSDGIQNQLSKLADFGYLEDNYPSNIVSAINWEDETQPLELRVRSYLDINCSHCHQEQGICEYRPMRLTFNETTDQVNMGVCVEPDDLFDETLAKIITPGRADKSLMVFRISSILPEYRMPLLGRTLKHTEGVQLLEDWINSLETNCE